MTDQVDNLASIQTIRESHTHNSEFVTSILDQFDRNGSLSPKQWEAVNRIADNIRNPKPKIVLDFAAIIAIFTAASAHLKYPKVRLALAAYGEANGGLLNVVLGRAGNKSRQPGTINVTNGGKYGEPNNKWFGRIKTDGTFQRSQDCSDGIVKLLQAFSADPAGVASDHGKFTGNCCFCGRSLTDGRSTDVGYGPVCAENFGLAWGVKETAVA